MKVGGRGGCECGLLTDLTLFSLSLSLWFSGRRRTGCRGSSRRLWSSWYASLSAPLSTPWPRAAPSAGSRRSARGARRSEGQLAVTGSHQLHRSSHSCPPNPHLSSPLPLPPPLADTPLLSQAKYQPPSGFSLFIVATCLCSTWTSIDSLFRRLCVW